MHTERNEGAEELFILTIQLCSIHFPHSIEYANCLLSLGALYGSIGRLEEAVVKVKDARLLYEIKGTQTDLDRCDSVIQLLLSD